MWLFVGLKDGKNVITIAATDAFGNETKQTFIITKVDATSTTLTQGKGKTPAKADADQKAGYKAGYKDGAAGKKLKSLAGKSAAYISGFTEGYNAGNADAEAKTTGADGKKAAKANAKAAKSAAKAAKKAAKASGSELPQMGNEASGTGAAFGMALLAAAGALFGFGIRPRRH